MKERPKGVTDLLPEDLEALGLTEERIMGIVLGPQRGVPAPATTDDWHPPQPVPDPRKGMSLDKARLFVGPGECIYIDFDRGMGGTIEEPEISEKYILSFPSGYVTDEIGLGEAIRLLLEISYSYNQAVEIMKKAQSYRHTALWPREGIHRTVVSSEERTYYV